MTTRTISIRVSDRAARIYEAASDEERRKLDALLSLRLSEAARTGRSLEEIMSDISRKAQARGLTPDILAEILDEQG